MLLYSVVYTCLELIYSLFQFKEIAGNDNVKQLNSVKKAKVNIFLTCIEAFIHGLIIILSVYYTLSNVRLDTSKILPIQAFDMAIFVILIIVSSFRNIFNHKMDLSFFLITTAITLVVMVLLVFLIHSVDPHFSMFAQQFQNLFRTYDSITMIINVSILCLTISMFIEEIVKKMI